MGKGNAKKTGRTKLIVSEVILAVLAAAAILCGIFYDSFVSYMRKGTDPCTLTDSDAGKTFTFKCTDNILAKDCDSILYYEGEESSLAFYVKVPVSCVPDFKYMCSYNSGTYKGTLRVADESIRAFQYETMCEYYEDVAGKIEDFEFTDVEKEMLWNEIPQYYIELESLDLPASQAHGITAFVIGIILALVVIIRLISALTKVSAVKMSIITAAVVVVLIAIAGIIALDKVKTVMSIKKEADGLYTMTCYEDLKIDELLEADIGSIEDFYKWIADAQFYGIQLSYDEESFGCASFVCSNAEGDTLMGRNFDYDETDELVIYNKPKNGYASYSFADLTVLDVSRYKTSPDSLEGRLYMLAAPYACVDGVNEAGLAASILELRNGETHEDNGKKDMLIYCAIRIILDKCATVDEAVSLLEKHDIHTDIDVSYHLNIADKSGRSVVVEWLDGEMSVLELSAVTNSVLTPGAHFDEGEPDDRLAVLNNKLEQNAGMLTEDEARDLLKEVSQTRWTEWSCVYNLNDFSVTVYLDMDYSKGYTFGGLK